MLFSRLQPPLSLSWTSWFLFLFYDQNPESRYIVLILFRILTCTHPGVNNIFQSCELLLSNMLLKFTEGVRGP